MGLFCFLLLLVAASLAAPITFPGYVGPDLHGDAGYLTHGTSRLYYIHTSLVPPEQVETLLFWFQGGPGGTSWIGLATEMGPIEFVDAKTALYRPINWLQANKNTTAMVFIDNPACIGFSYTTDANKTRGCASGDSLAADQNAAIVPQFLNEMMQGVYRNTSFFITGESWGGEYIPTMAAQPSISTLSNFRGILIGNPVFRCFASSDPAEDRVGDTWTEFNQLYWNGYISQDVYERWRDSDCDSESRIDRASLSRSVSISFQASNHTIWIMTFQETTDLLTFAPATQVWHLPNRFVRHLRQIRLIPSLDCGLTTLAMLLRLAQ